MDKLFKCFAILIVLFLFSSAQCFCADYNSLYVEALNITKNSFYDSSMNHQDWNYWLKHYNKKLKNEDDFRVAITSALASLDDYYTRYLPEENFDSERNNIHNDETQSLFTTQRYFKTRIPKHIKYIRIDSMMNKNLSSEVENFIKESEKDKKLKGYIIDIRDNGGGLVKNATNIASLFMNNKIVLYAKTNKRMVQNTTPKDKAITSKPVVILINENTASSCEVFTGAMQDNNRAYVIGTKSFGKGIIQQIKKLSNGSGLHVTVMAYYTPEMKEINKKGISPDEEVSFSRKDIFFHKDIQLLRSIKWLEGN